MEIMGKKPRRRRSFTPEFKAEIVDLCQRGDRGSARGKLTGAQPTLIAATATAETTRPMICSRLHRSRSVSRASRTVTAG